MSTAQNPKGSRTALGCLLLGRHRWGPHPGFTAVPVRRCSRCGRCETTFGTRMVGGGWRRVKHIEHQQP